MTQTCPACNSAVDDSARFCTECGQPMGEAAAPSSPSSPAALPPAAPSPPSPPPQPQPQPPVYSSSAGQPGPGPGHGYGGPPPKQEAPGLIPYHNKPALFGYYFAVFSLIPCFGLPLGITAIILGAMGMRKHREDPSIKGKGHALTALILGGITTLVWGVLLVLTIVGIAAEG
ncbi:MAG TPA: DUF4190 domain-containing protein [Thermoanaerobaculia bacterium]|nr:DUF4190 domain-containing protein [Thermoanaerobaculia bacterium]